jgi:hypothetical protein
VIIRSSLLLFVLLRWSLALAQPDTLFVGSGDTLFAFAVVYQPLQDAEQYTRIGHYAHDTSKVAVQLGYKRGKPSGVYRAFYPDGRPLIFAVYGWGALHGDWTEYDEFGRITVKGQYRNGLRDGTWAFRKDGIVGKYKEGLEHGKWKYYANGRLIRIEKFHKGQAVQGGSFQVR